MVLRMLQGLTEQYSHFVTDAKQESSLVAYSHNSDDDMNHQNSSQGNLIIKIVIILILTVTKEVLIEKTTKILAVGTPKKLVGTPAMAQTVWY